MRCFLVGAALLLAACQTPAPRPAETNPVDVHSFARPDRVRVRHLTLDVALDFDQRQVRGTATLALERIDQAAPLRLDTMDLHIAAVRGDDGEPREHRLGTRDPQLGMPLEIDLRPGDRNVTIEYRTHPGAAALQWLDADQTDARQGPFLYTQGQAILTRSWIPLQDSPGVRITYDARVAAPEGLAVVMAAGERSRDSDGTHRFRMTRPIPAYLLALACGTLASRDISPRCAVWAEPSIVEKAAAELSDMDDMLAACERLFGPYRWDRYDVLVLPPAFPFGGMENPTLTFATPTILAGDKSLVALIAHELAHSWSGNLVTNATWRDFWLNEGFTVYLEHRIMEEIYGRERAEMEILLGLQGLEKELAELPAADQVLHVDLEGRNPDDGMTSVPYDKGAAFLRLLEERFGRERFDAFLSAWFDEHAFESVTTGHFLVYLQENLLAHDPAAAAGIDVDRWVRRPGLPSAAPRPRSPRLEAVEASVQRWRDGGDQADLAALGAGDWTTHEWLRFLATLPADIHADELARLDARFALTKSGNSEILAAWLERATIAGYAPAAPALEEFLLRVGRRKFLKPLYEALVKSPPQAGVDGLTRARATYARARPRYHAVARRTLDDLLGVEEEGS
ncbi:MAG: M1 family metallopeptidase [Planctomycetota bacterium]